MLSYADNSEKVSHARNRKKKKKRNKFTIALAIVAGLMVLYIIGAIFAGFRGRLTTVTALNGSVSEKFRTKGYVFREQTVIEAPKTGFMVCIVREGERVKKDEVLAYIYDTLPNSESVEKIKEIHKIIANKGIETKASIYMADGGSIDTNISDTVRNLSDKRTKNNISYAKEAKEKMILVMNNSSSANQEMSNKSIDELEAELKNILSQSGNGTPVISPVGGVFSSRLDGYEEKLDYGNMSKMTVSEMKELDKVTYKQSETVEGGQALCKIINNYVWNYATIIEEKESENLKAGQAVKLQIFDLSSTEIEGTISYISDVQDGYVVLGISTNKYIEGVYSSSKINADVVTVSSSGIKLPEQSLRVLDGVTGVYVLRLDVARFVPVNIKYKNEDWAIVSAAEPKEVGGAKLQIYDEVITESKNVENGKLMR